VQCPADVYRHQDLNGKEWSNMVNDKDVAVVGMSCIFPRAANLEQYWSNLVNGVDAIGRPVGRWTECSNFRRSASDDAFIPSDRGGYLDPGLTFDPLAYGIQPNLVRNGDADQFFALHLIDQALHDARVAEDSPLRRRTDVLVGQGGFLTWKRSEWGLRTEYFEAILELIERHSPGLLGGRRQELEAYLRGALTAPEADNISSGVSTLTACRAANRLNLRGTASVVDGACASSLLAVEQAVGRLRNGQCDLAVAAGVFVALTVQVLYVFTRLGALSPSGIIHPFDRRADGLLPGEGGGAVVLKRLSDAIRDGDEVYAIVRGAGSASDGREVDVLAPCSAGQIAALEAAYADAGVARDSVGYLELHGTGTVAGDTAEIAAVKGFFGTVQEPATARAMGSVKSMIGHTLPAAGMAGLIKAALSLSNKVLCPSLHCEQPRPELADAPFYINTQTRPWIHNPARGPRRAGVNAFGFGGINAHVILEEVPAPRKIGVRSQGSGVRGQGAEALPPLTPAPCLLNSGEEEARPRPRPLAVGLGRPSELAVFSAGSMGELTAKLERLERFLDQDGTSPTLADVTWSLTGELDLHQPVKLALVCANVEHLRRLLRRWRESKGAADGSRESGEVYFSAEATRHDGKIAFVFPGMGFPGLTGDYPERLMELCLHDPEVREEFDHFEDRDSNPEDTVPTSALFAPPACLPEEYRRRLKCRLHPPVAREPGTGGVPPLQRNLSVMGVTLSNWVGWQLLRKFQVPVDMLVGESLGDLTALCAAGGADFHRLAPAFWKALDLEGRAANDGLLAFALASAEQVAPLLAENPGTHVAIFMAREGVVFGGDSAGVRRVTEQLRERQVYVQPLPYPPIHTPHLNHLRDELRQLLGGERALFRKPDLDVYSSTTVARYPDDEWQIFETLLINVDHPLRTWETALRLYQDGARIFVQVGGSRSAVHRMVLPEGVRVTAAALDGECQNPLTQLNHLLATLLCAGVPLQLEPLYEHRRVRDLDFDRPGPAPTPSRTAIPLRLAWSLLPPREASLHQPEEPAVPRAPSEGTPADESATAGEGLGAGAAAAALPVLGQVTHFVPHKELTLRRTLDLSEDLYLNDHLFVYAPHKPARDCLPVMPLTMSMELAAEAAALLCPGLGLIGFETVRGHRWIALLDVTSLELRIDARAQALDSETGARRVEVSLFSTDEVCFSATVLFAGAYRQDLDFEIGDPATDGPWPITAAQVYSEGYMFHGPAFQCIAELSTMGNPVSSAVLAVPPRAGLFASRPEALLLTDPCLLDAAGQVVGLWARLNGQYILPFGVDKVEFYGPSPPPGTRIPIHIEIVELDWDAQRIRSNLELEDGDGNVWARLLGWTVYVWKCSFRYVDATELPHRHVWAQELELPGAPAGSVCTALTRADFEGLGLERVARQFLHETELPEVLALPDRGQQQEFLRSRVAAKDAVRLWWARRHGTEELPHPSQFVIAHDESGRPYLVRGDGPEMPYLSLAHTAGGAVAITADVPAGIDLEPASRDARPLLSHFATAGEIGLVELLGQACPEDVPATRLWCAKEAMAKARGTGLLGRPKDFEALTAERDGDFLMRHGPSGDRMVVHTAWVGPFLVALTSAHDKKPPEARCS
jgi:acyl transferase domain-containing protein/phosphopantetheinyl transferase